MARITSLTKIGQRLSQGLKRKGATTTEVMKAVGGRTLPTWYRWINGDQEGGCRDIAMAGLFVGLRPDELLLEDENDKAAESGFTEADVVGLEQIRKMLSEMSQLTDSLSSDDRPVSVVVRHVEAVLKVLKAHRKASDKISTLSEGTQMAAESGPEYGKKKKRAKKSK